MTIHNFFIVYMEVIITKSKKKDKKFDATIDGKKTISFGAKGYTDFTQSKDPAQKQRYLNRHRAREDWTNPKTAGFIVQMYFGIKQQLNHQLQILIKSFLN